MAWFPPPPRAPQKPRWDCAVWTCDAWEWMGVLGWRWGHEIQNPADMDTQNPADMDSRTLGTWTPRTLGTWTPEPWGHELSDPGALGYQIPGNMDTQIPGDLGIRTLGTWAPDAWQPCHHHCPPTLPWAPQGRLLPTWVQPLRGYRAVFAARASSFEGMKGQGLRGKLPGKTLKSPSAPHVCKQLS